MGPCLAQPSAVPVSDKRPTYQLQQFPSADTLAQHAAQLWVTEVEAAGRRGQSHLVALSGGRIALKFFEATVATARQRGVSFAPVHFFWADERCVPPDHADSNYRVANQLLLEPLGIAAGQIHRLRGEVPEARAVRAAAGELSRLASINSSGQPVLDLVLLGMGEDGHVASLFPDEADAAVESADVYRGVLARKPPPRRLTLGYGVIAAAKAVWVLASGQEKEAALRDALRLGGATPLGRVLEHRSNTLILSDVQASQGMW